MWHVAAFSPVAVFSPQFIGITVHIGYLNLLIILFAFLVQPISSVYVAMKWKEEWLRSIFTEIDHDEKHCWFLIRQRDETLAYVEHLLDRRLSRGNSASQLIPGRWAAYLSLVGLTCMFVMRIDGHFEFIQLSNKWVQQGATLAVMLGIFFVLFIVSIGSLSLKFLKEKYRYQLELVRLAIRIKRSPQARKTYTTSSDKVHSSKATGPIAN
jgi:hypothetical protein